MNKTTMRRMIYRTSIFVAFLFIISCSHKEQFPDFVFEKVELEHVSLNTQLPLITTSKTNNLKITGLDKLVIFQNQFLEKSLDFNLDDFKRNWNQIQKENDFGNASFEDLTTWFEVSGFLLELTGETIFAEEMEKRAFSGWGETIEENKKRVIPFIFTRNIDNLFINLFIPSTINYNHSTKGKVKVEMETNFPQSGKLDLKFNMTERRYIEVNIRIPSWAKGATVTVKRVKYFAPPGGYCKIAKKWKEDDLVEINFPLENLPEYMK